MRRGLLVVLLASACNSPQGGERLGEADPRNVPPVRVELPPPPAFDKPKVPRAYPDQTLSVFGLRHGMDEKLGKEVQVRAIVVETYECPACARHAKCPPCDLPHFWIGDAKDAGKDSALLVADMPFDDRGKYKKLDLVAGQTVVVTGTFARHSNTGFSSSEGLLIYKAHTPAP